MKMSGVLSLYFPRKRSIGINAMTGAIISGYSIPINENAIRILIWETIGRENTEINSISNSDTR